MLKTIKEILRKMFCKELPLWAYGLECQVCQMTLINPEAHCKEVMQNGALKKHQGKIPILKK